MDLGWSEAMSFTMTSIDLGMCEGRVYDQGAEAWGVILPGAMLLPDAPLLWFAREAALAAGRNVLAVWDTFDRNTDPLQWIEERTRAALDRIGADPRTPPVIIAKSLTSLASGTRGRSPVAGRVDHANVAR
jgi:hypothetical protein